MATDGVASLETGSGVVEWPRSRLFDVLGAAGHDEDDCNCDKSDATDDVGGAATAPGVMDTGCSSEFPGEASSSVVGGTTIFCHA